MGMFSRWLDHYLGDAPVPAAADPGSEVVERFSADIPTPVDDYILAQQVERYLAQPVTREQALSVEAVLRGRNLICSVSTLPIVERDKAGKIVESRLLEQPDNNTPNVVFWASLVEDLLFEAIAWCRVVEWEPNGFPRKMTKLDVKTVSLTPPKNVAKGLRTLPSGAQLPVGTVWVDGKPEAPRDSRGRPVIVRFDSPNPPVLKAAARAIRRLLLLEASSARYADNPRAQDYFSPVDGADPLDDPEIAEILAAWKLARKRGSTGYIPAALEYHSVDAFTPVELQIIDQQKQAMLSIANALGLDPEDLGISTTSRTYQNGVDRRQDRVNDVFSMYMSAITDRLKMQDMTRRGHTVGYWLDEYLKADPKTRWETHKMAVEMYAKDVADVREEEGLSPKPELERAAKAAQKAAATPPTAPQDEVARKREQRVTASAQFSTEGDEDETITFALTDDDAAQFSADVDRRTITGLMVPWGVVNTGTYAKWRFHKGSIKLGKDLSRVKLNMEHSRSDSFAYLKKAWATERGLMGTFQVDRSEEGTKALHKAQDKVKDGFSIEVSFPNGADGWEMTEAGNDFVRDVRPSGAHLTGCALTAAPSFDDARLTKVAASRTTNREEGLMPDDNKPDAGGTLTMTPEVQAAFSTAVSEGVKVALEGQNEVFATSIQALIDAQQKPGEVNPDGSRKAQFEVNEAPIYRFDGVRGEHDFSSDLVAAHKNNDHEALKRAQTFLGEYFSNREFNARIGQLASMLQQQANFAVTTSNVATLNPSVNRPDMYVDQLQYPTPIWDAVRKGTISDNTPFVLPKFNTSSGLVADHVQGTEPTPGALTTTSQTITPTAVSGKVEVTREAWDQGGNPQLSVIIWRQMVRAWDEALEQGAAALLESLSPAAVTLTAGGVDDVLVDEVTGAIVDLHFIRGGFRFQDFFLEKGLYKRLSQAKDADGRKLLPILGPQNADGSAGPLMASLNVAGLAGRPSWALPYVGAAPNDSYIFNREDVHGWASAPQRLDFEYRVAFVDIALWGYKAFACTRVDGVRKFIYDETA